ncbi:MAG: hypothetical protein NTY77_16565 [Elusimicrobia bacterium]|nr:hypothetical protein [Elusimicrobiota bacterium]
MTDKTRAAAAVLLLLSGWGAGARAETFIMKSGSRFEGRLLSATTDYLGVSVQGRALDIRRDSIRRIDYEPDWDGRSVRLGERVIKAGFGGALPLTSYGFKRVANGGSAADVEFLVHCKPEWDLGLRLDSMGFTKARPQSATLDGTAQVQASVLLLEGRWLPRPGRRVSPFLVGGLGANVYSEEIEMTPKAGSVWSDTGTREMREIDETSTGLAVMLGGGVQVLLSRSYVADFEAGWHYWTIAGAKFGNSIQSSSQVQAVSLLARLGWRF